MTVQTFLNQSRELEKRIYRLETSLAFKKEKLDGCRTVWGEHVSAHSQEASYVRLMEEIDEVQRKLEADRALQKRLQGQIRQMLRALQNEDLRSIIIYYDLEGMTYSRIGDLLYLNKSTIYRWHKEALSMLELPENPADITKEGSEAPSALNPVFCMY